MPVKYTTVDPQKLVDWWTRILKKWEFPLRTRKSYGQSIG